MNPFLKAVGVKARIINALFVHSLLTEHGKSKIGYPMAVIKPLFQIAILSTMFTILGRTPSIGDSLVLFLATGIITYNLCIALANKMLKINKQYRNILGSTHISSFDISIAFLLSESLILSLSSMLILMGLGVFGYWDHKIDSLLGILTTFIAAVGLGYGVGLFNASLILVVPAYEKVWKIVSMPLFVMSGVLFTVDQRFPPEVIAILKYNPLLHIVESMRDSFYRSWESTLFDLNYVLWFILCSSLAGLLMQKITQKRPRL